MDRLEEIFSLMIPRGIGLELNTNRGNDPLPSANILRLYRQMGGEIVTIGSDAHVPEHIGLFQPALEIKRGALSLLHAIGKNMLETYGLYEE